MYSKTGVWLCRRKKNRVRKVTFLIFLLSREITNCYHEFSELPSTAEADLFTEIRIVGSILDTNTRYTQTIKQKKSYIHDVKIVLGSLFILKKNSSGNEDLYPHGFNRTEISNRICRGRTTNPNLSGWLHFEEHCVACK